MNKEDNNYREEMSLGMSKPVVRYIPVPRGLPIVVGSSAVVIPLDHPGNVVNNGEPVITTRVRNYDPETGEFETKNTRYILDLGKESEYNPDSIEESPKSVSFAADISKIAESDCLEYTDIFNGLAISTVAYLLDYCTEEGTIDRAELDSCVARFKDNLDAVVEFGLEQLSNNPNNENS